jgi:6-phosphogluconate dehydrogenase
MTALQQVAAVIFSAILGVGNAMAIKEAQYTVVLEEQNFEVRNYEPHVVAETLVNGDFDKAVTLRQVPAYAEGLNILHNANVGLRDHAVDAETTALRQPTHSQYEVDLPEIAEVWRRGSVLGAWLLDLTAAARAAEPTLTRYAGRVADSGEGRWTIQAAIDEAVPTPVLSAALSTRFSSRGEADFANRVQSAMRHEFGGHGGHVEKPIQGPGSER